MDFKKILIGAIFCIMGMMIVSPVVFSQDALEERVTQIEKYLDTIRPTLLDFSDQLQKSVQDYTTQLETSLTDFSQGLQADVDQRLAVVDKKSVVLDPTSKEFQRIDTNTGVFLISVDKLEKIDDGYRLALNVGNPNYADYRDFSIQLLWGDKWDGGRIKSYEQWRSSLKGAEYSFQGALKKGQWSRVEVDIAPADSSQLGYIECRMAVLSVEMQKSE